MGEKSNINFELGPGTIYFSDSSEFGVEVESVEYADDCTYVPNFMTVSSRDTEQAEFTATINPSFRGLATLLGFWPAVKYKVRQWRFGLVNIWVRLRTPIEEDDE